MSFRQVFSAIFVTLLAHLFLTLRHLVMSSKFIPVGHKVDAAKHYGTVCPNLKDGAFVCVIYTGDGKSEIVEVRVRDIDSMLLIARVFYVVLRPSEIDQ